MNPEQRLKGRPPKLAKGAVRKMYYDSELHKLLVERMPEFVQGGRITVPALARAIGYSPARVYITLQDNRMSVKFLNKLLNLATEYDGPEENRLCKDDLLKFLLN